MTQKDRETLRVRGFVKVDVRTSREPIETLAASLGPITFDPRYPQEVRDISPTPAQSAPPNTLASRYGLGAFPFHTDTAHWVMPCRFVVFRCISPGSGARPTLLIDADRAFSELEIGEGVWVTAFVRPRLCSARADGPRPIWRYNPDCMRPYSLRAKEESTRMRRRLDDETYVRHRWDAGDVLVVDNWRMLHARGPTMTPDTDRVLTRVLVGGMP